MAQGGSAPGPTQTAAVGAWLQALQLRIVQALEAVDGATFVRDVWRREEGGGGTSCVLEGGRVFERAAVLHSEVQVHRLPPSASAARPLLAGRPARAMGVSLVLHPRNPYVPTVHMNVRHFVAPATSPDNETVWWFGGGMDLTPYYGFDEDVVHFHRCCAQALAPFGPGRHARYKAWCDEYFFLKHRDEPRGVGGIFFDDVCEPDFDTCFSMLRSVGEAFIPAYLPSVKRRMNMAYGEREREFQALRRGRYVEFNLVFDRGTLFGLHSGGRTASILCSMPPQVRWQYDDRPTPGSAEAQLRDHFLQPRDWLAYGDERSID